MNTVFDDIFIVPPPPCVTSLLSDDYLASLTIPPPPQYPGDWSSGTCPPPPAAADPTGEHRVRQHSDVDSDYHSVGDSPTSPDFGKTARTSPVGASPSTCDESYIRTTLPEDEVTVRARNHPDAAAGRSHDQPDAVGRSRLHPNAGRSRATHPPLHECKSEVPFETVKQQDLQQNRMYSSLQRPSTAAARSKKQRERHGSHNDILNEERFIAQTDLRNSDFTRTHETRDTRPATPLSPRDESTLLGNLGFEEEPVLRQTVQPDVHRAIDHFIRSEQRYIADINSLLNLHIEPLRYQGCLNIDVINSLKSSLLRLLHFHQRTCDDFEFFFSNLISQTREGQTPDYFTMVNYMCDILMEYRGGFKTYINFCSTRAQLIRNIGSMDTDETSRWEKYCDQCNPSGDPSHSLEAGLAMPVQRVRDYPAMLTDIKIRGGVRSGILAEKIGRACSMLEGVAKAVDERIRMQQEFSCLYRNNKKLEVLIGPIEELLYYGAVVEVKSRDIENFVPEQDSNLLLLVYKKGAAVVQRHKIKKKHSFNKLLATAPGKTDQEYSLKKFYPVSCLQVRDLPHNHVFELTDTVAQQRVILASRSLDTKAELIKNVADIIMDYDRFLSSSLQIKDSV